MATGNITGKANVPTKITTYSGLESETAIVDINNQTNNKTIEVNVKSVPNSLEITPNSASKTKEYYDGSEEVSIDASPIVILDEDEEPDYSDENLNQIFRRPNGDNFIHEPFILTKESSEPVDVYVDAPKDNTGVTSENFFSMFDDEDALRTLVDSVSITSVTTYVPQSGDINAFRIGTSSGVGTITMILNYTVDSIILSARKYNTEANGKLIVNGIETELSFDFDDYTIRFPSKTSTITISNASSSGQKQRILLNRIATGSGSGEVLAEKELAFKDDIPTDYVDLSSNQTIRGNKTLNGNTNFNGYVNINTTRDDCYVNITNQDPDSAFLEVSCYSINPGFTWRFDLDETAIYEAEEELECHITFPGRSGEVALETRVGNIEITYDEDEDETYIKFPRFCLPQSLYEIAEAGCTLYFNYKDYIIVDSFGHNYGDGTLSIDTTYSQVILTLSGDRSDFTINNIVYSKFDNLYNTNSTLGVDYSHSEFAKKGQTLVAYGTFDENGEFTIDTTQVTIPDGMYFVTYGNAQAFIYISATMLANANTSPLMAPMPVVYGESGETMPGMLRIARDGTTLNIKVALDDNIHVREDFTMYFFKTNLA